MSFYKSVTDMYSSRALQYKHEGDRHWAMAKSGKGNYHYGKARLCYEQAEANRAREEKAKASGASFRRK